MDLFGNVFGLKTKLDIGHKIKIISYSKTFLTWSEGHFCILKFFMGNFHTTLKIFLEGEGNV